MSYVVKTTLNRGMRAAPDTVEIGRLPAHQVKGQDATPIAVEDEALITLITGAIMISIYVIVRAITAGH